MSAVLEELVGNMSIAELARLAGTSVEQVVSKVLGSAPSNGATRRAAAPPNGDGRAAPTSAPKAGGRPPKKIPKGGLSTADVLAVVAAAKGPIGAQDVRAKVGGSAAQVRAALAKLQEAGRVKITGERRGTRYHAK